jgi:HPt (histidine-containing phosphotransfer) domain-containing protein
MRDKLMYATVAIDMDAIESLRHILREDFNPVIDSFIKNTRRYLGLIGLALAENDRVSLIMSAHKLASSAGQVGFMKLSEISREIEMKAGYAPTAEINRYYVKAEKAFQEALNILKPGESIR